MSSTKEKPPGLGERLATALSNAISGPATPPPTPPRHPLDGVPQPGPQTVAAIGRAAKWSLPGDVRKQLAELDAAWQKAFDAMLAHSYDKAREAFRQQEAERTRLIREGKDTAKLDAWSQDDYFEDYGLKLKTYKAEQRRLCVEARELLKPHFEAFATACEKFGQGMEEKARAEHDNFGIGYRPDNIVLAAFKCAETARRYALTFSATAGNRPSAFFANILPVE